MKLHFTTNADGTLSVRVIEIADPTQIGDDNGMVENSNHDINDDHGGSSNTRDDGSNHDTNDDHGGNSGGGNDNSGGNSGSGG